LIYIFFYINESNENDSEEEPKEPTIPAKPPSSSSKWILYALLLLIVSIFVLKCFEMGYDYNYDTFISYYEILGLEASPQTDISEIKRAFKVLALKWHPDKNPGCMDCNEKYYEISKAHDELVVHHVQFWKIQEEKKHQDPTPQKSRTKTKKKVKLDGQK